MDGAAGTFVLGFLVGARLVAIPVILRRQNPRRARAALRWVAAVVGAVSGVLSEKRSKKKA